MYPDIFGKVAKETDIPVEVVEKAYKSYFEFIRKTIQALPLKEDIDEEQFSELRTNFNLPSLGKLTCTYDRMVRMKRRFEIINKFRQENAKVKED